MTTSQKSSPTTSTPEQSSPPSTLTTSRVEEIKNKIRTHRQELCNNLEKLKAEGYELDIWSEDGGEDLINVVYTKKFTETGRL